MVFFFLPFSILFSQHTSRDNYTGYWETPASWDPVWEVPLIVIEGEICPSVTINGYITSDESLSFTSAATNLIINDTLIINGDLNLDNNNDLTVNDNGILIIWGNLTISNQTQLITNGYLIVIGNVYKGGSSFQGSWTSNEYPDNPVKVFIGGTIPTSFSENSEDYTAVTCPSTVPYPDSGCSYGNLTDLENDPIYAFLQSRCSLINTKGTITVCAAETLSLTSAPAASYSWSGPNGFTSNLQNPSIPEATLSMTGNYKIVATNAGCTDTDTIEVIVNAIPETPTISANGPLTFCEGSSVTLTSSAGSTYLWSTGETTGSIIVASSGSFTVRVTSAGGCQSAASEVTVVLANSAASTPTINPDGPTTICAGDSVMLTSSSGISYLWSNEATTESIVVTESGDYTVQVTNIGGCLSAASEVTVVKVNSLPPAPAITTDGPTTFCSGELVTLTSSAGTNYLWSTGSTSSSINVTAAGSYNVKIIDSNGCYSLKSDDIQVNINALPIATAGSNSPVCEGNILNLTSSGGTTYKWSGPNGFISSIQNPSISNVITAMTGTYKVTVSTSQGCTATDTLDITVNENPVAYAGADQDLKFIFESVMNADLSASETGEWTLVSGSARITDIHSPVTGLTELGLGRNVFTWEVFSGTCKASDEVIIFVEDLFIPSVITPNGDGKNEFFIINSLTMSGAERAELIILNKWGSVEYRNKNYLNDWDGKNDRGDYLENDTYMYLLRFENGFTRKGTVLITR